MRHGSSQAKHLLFLDGVDEMNSLISVVLSADTTTTHKSPPRRPKLYGSADNNFIRIRCPSTVKFLHLQKVTHLGGRLHQALPRRDEHSLSAQRSPGGMIEALREERARRCAAVTRAPGRITGLEPPSPSAMRRRVGDFGREALSCVTTSESCLRRQRFSPAGRRHELRFEARRSAPGRRASRLRIPVAKRSARFATVCCWPPRAERGGGDLVVGALTRSIAPSRAVVRLLTADLLLTRIGAQVTFFPARQCRERLNFLKPSRSRARFARSRTQPAVRRVVSARSR